MTTREAGAPDGLLILNNPIFTACNVNVCVQICGNCTFVRGVSWLDRPTPNLILHLWKTCIGRGGDLSLAAPSSVRGDFEVISSFFVTKHEGSKPHPELVPQYQSPRCHAVSHFHGQRCDRLKSFYVWVSVHHTLIYIKKTNLMQSSSMFIGNCKIALHVSAAYCVHLQEH